MRKIKAKKIEQAVERLYIKANYNLPKDVEQALKKSVKNETSKTAKNVLNILLENSEISKKELIPICQDTGLAIVFAEIGQDVCIVGGGFKEAINRGVKNAVKQTFLRTSVVGDPFDRINTKNNTPAIIHTDIVPGDKIKISVMAKGAGSENMSALKMLKPSDGIDGVIDFVLDTVKNAGPNPCPPIVVGIGIGGNFEKSAYLAKRSLLRRLGKNNPQKSIAQLEKLLLSKINKLKIGPSGFGGKTTCLGVNIETLPCHIASLPVAVNIECHAHRHAKVEI
ncbi:MAG: fumarate hydratase [Candidatus Margulisiibacteriota bacterium]